MGTSRHRTILLSELYWECGGGSWSGPPQLECAHHLLHSLYSCRNLGDLGKLPDLVTLEAFTEHCGVRSPFFTPPEPSRKGAETHVKVLGKGGRELGGRPYLLEMDLQGHCTVWPESLKRGP